MNKKGCWRHCYGGCVLLAVLVVPLMAETLPEISFSVRPRLCVLAAGETLCRDEVEVHWRTQQERSLCLFTGDDQEPLTCWQQAVEGEYKTLLETGSDIQFQLKEMADNELLVSQSFEVVQDDRRYRRKRRNPWSFF